MYSDYYNIIKFWEISSFNSWWNISSNTSNDIESSQYIRSGTILSNPNFKNKLFGFTCSEIINSEESFKIFTFWTLNNLNF